MSSYEIPPAPSAAIPSGLWVFAYGSLMWRPEFDFETKQPALLYGYHRAFCVYSYVHRGTPEHPGLVLGLDRGGACRGIAYHVSAVNADEVRAYLRERELATNVYVEAFRQTRLLPSHEQVNALCFVVERSHRQYARRLPLEDQARLIRQGVGGSGANPEYLANTVAHLTELGIRDPHIEALNRMVMP